MRPLVIAGMLVALLMLIPVGSPGLLAQHPALRTALQNFAHPVAFAALAMLGRRAISRSGSSDRLRHHLALAGSLVLFAALTEFLQGFVARDESFADFVGDLLGICVGFLWPPRSRLAAFAVTVSIALASAPLVLTLSAYLYRHIQHPQIWHVDSLLLNRFSRWQTGNYPGLVLEEVPADWRGYHALAIRVHSPDSANASFTVRIHDAHHDQRQEDRFNQTFHLAAGATDVFQIPISAIEDGPKDRPLDLKAVAGIVVFQSRSEARMRVTPVEIHLIP